MLSEKIAGVYSLIFPRAENIISANTKTTAKSTPICTTILATNPTFYIKIKNENLEYLKNNYVYFFSSRRLSNKYFIIILTYILFYFYNIFYNKINMNILTYFI